MNAEMIFALVQLGRFAFDSIELLQKGEMTEAEIAAEFEKLDIRLDRSNALWEGAGR